MKILLLAPIHDYSAYVKQKSGLPFVEGQGQQSWFEALESLGHEVKVYKYTDAVFLPQTVATGLQHTFERLFPRMYARWRRFLDHFYVLNPTSYVRHFRILSIFLEFEPDLVMFSGGTSNILTGTFRKMHRTTPIILLSGINPKTSSSAVERFLIRKGHIDVIATNDRGYASEWAKLGAKKVVTLPISSVDPRLHMMLKLTTKEKQEFSCDVCFIGSLSESRQQSLKQLLHFDLKIWGTFPPNVKLDPALSEVYQGNASGRKMVKIFNGSRINLNFQPSDMTYGGNMRTFEICGSGAFQLADRIDPDWMESGKHFVEFKDIEDLIQKISYFLSHTEERQKIALQGCKNAHSQHTYAKHFKKLLDMYES